MRLTEEQRLAWLQLSRCEGVGPSTFRTLIARFGTAAAALDALPELARREGRTIRLVSRAEAEREMERAMRFGVRFVALGEPDYPAPLRAAASAPPLIGLRGDASILAGPAVAIVGSRNASANGLKFTERLARDLGEAGFTIVSGLARGIDARAHGASLLTGTVAVLAGGQDRVYPPENESLLARILERGAVLSEMPMGWEPRGRDFPRRNRIISGLSLGVVVVEAARKSGSLITARFALEQGREVFAVPGSPLDPRAEGTNDLIREGATLCGAAEHVISVLTPLVAGGGLPRAMEDAVDQEAAVTVGGERLWDELDLPEVEPAPWYAREANGLGEAMDHGSARPPGSDDGAEDEERPDDERLRLLVLMGPAPVTVDELVRQSGLAVRAVQRVLLELELAGRLERHGGNAVSLL
ncbi:DNA-processing protein DprA [Chelatococcus sp. SYSU_G07232]|uniref:DNA-processing protein DprA n=1 Tax=Chelatococcus albus TaxID=3047466 RepID=A0ABT7ACT7_9HYPH|nr:DNA-processing protein DprA [Chelatococcus sp. SYSU_G07232]MDJ1157188.1 DNA-processing protein DprA [Chelatococcus sp. SYSU_G07232]